LHQHDKDYRFDYIAGSNEPVEADKKQQYWEDIKYVKVQDKLPFDVVIGYLFAPMILEKALLRILRFFRHFCAVLAL